MRKLPIISCVYKITNTSTKKIYIGSTKNFYKRKRDHRAKLNRNQHDNLYLQRSWNKYGAKTFQFDIIEKTNDLLTTEQHYLDTLKPEYNIGAHASGGDNLTNHPRRKEIIQQMRNATINRFKNMSPEERESIREKFRGKKTAARQLGVCPATICHRIKSPNPKFCHYEYI